jgi:hypothetical protein
LPQLLAELAFSLRDDLRPHVPELLPRLVALFVDAERNSSFDMVKPALEALEVRDVPFCSASAVVYAWFNSAAADALHGALCPVHAASRRSRCQHHGCPRHGRDSSLCTLVAAF